MSDFDADGFLSAISSTAAGRARLRELGEGVGPMTTTTDAASPVTVPSELAHLANTLTALGWEARVGADKCYVYLNALMRDDDLSTIHGVRIETQDPTDLGLIEAIEWLASALRAMEDGR